MEPDIAFPRTSGPVTQATARMGILYIMACCCVAQNHTSTPLGFGAVIAGEEGVFQPAEK